MAKCRRTGALPFYIARNRHRYRSGQFVEYSNDQRDLWQPGDPDPGYLAQYTVLPMRITSASLESIPRSLEHAAQLGGASWFMSLHYILVPLAKRGLIAAWLISYVFCLRDIGISMAVYPPGSDTLPVRILTLMANGAPSLIAALCVILIVVTLLPLGVVSLWLRHSARQS